MTLIRRARSCSKPSASPLIPRRRNCPESATPPVLLRESAQASASQLQHRIVLITEALISQSGKRHASMQYLFARARSLSTKHAINRRDAPPGRLRWRAAQRCSWRAPQDAFLQGVSCWLLSAVARTRYSAAAGVSYRSSVSGDASPRITRPKSRESSTAS
jgi:hypothetical protein